LIFSQETELESVLEQLKQQLNEKLQDESLKHYDTLITFAECELKSINAQISE